MSQRGRLVVDVVLSRRRRRWCLLASLFAAWTLRSQAEQRAASSAQQITSARAVSQTSQWTLIVWRSAWRYSSGYGYGYGYGSGSGYGYCYGCGYGYGYGELALFLSFFLLSFPFFFSWSSMVLLFSFFFFLFFFFSFYFFLPFS